MNPQIANFIREAVNRLRSKNPKFIFVCQCIGVALCGLGYLPAAFERWTTIVVSQQFINFCEDVSTGAIGFTLAFFFASDNQQKALTTTGDVLQKIDAEKYPFTAEVERKKADQVPVIPDPLPKTE